MLLSNLIGLNLRTVNSKKVLVQIYVGSIIGLINKLTYKAS